MLLKTCAYDMCARQFMPKYARQRFCSKSCASKDRALRTEDAIRAYFLRHVDMPMGQDACWRWTGPVNWAGYGMAFVDSGRVRAPRLAYQLYKGETPALLHILHSCNNRWCVNPQHLRLGTEYENSQDRVAFGDQPRGQSHYATRVTDEDVAEIRLAFSKWGHSLSDLAQRYHVKAGTISDIVYGRTHRHVDLTYVCTTPPRRYTCRKEVDAPTKARIRAERQAGATLRQLAATYDLTTKRIWDITHQPPSDAEPEDTDTPCAPEGNCSMQEEALNLTLRG